MDTGNGLAASLAQIYVYIHVYVYIYTYIHSPVYIKIIVGSSEKDEMFSLTKCSHVKFCARAMRLILLTKVKKLTARISIV